MRKREVATDFIHEDDHDDLVIEQCNDSDDDGTV